MKLNRLKGFSSYYLIDKGCGKRNLYKYMSMETALICLDTDSIRFSEPNMWPDKFEGLYYKSSYKNVDPDNKVPKKLWACCLALNKACEASWDVYCKGGSGLASRCVQFVIDRQELQRQLDAFAHDNGMKVYEGMADYSHSDYTIENLRKKGNPRYRQFFDPFTQASFLSLLLIKRQAYQYESELRFFIVPEDQTKVDKYLSVSLDWNKLLKRILIDKSCSEWEKKLFTNWVQAKYPSVPIVPFDIHAAPENFNYEIE